MLSKEQRAAAIERRLAAFEEELEQTYDEDLPYLDLDRLGMEHQARVEYAREQAIDTLLEERKEQLGSIPRLPTMTSQYLEKFIAGYREGKINEEMLRIVFRLLAEELFKNMKVSKEQFIHEAVYVCMEKLDKYDPTVGKAFNYFTTIMLCSFRQIKALQKRLEMSKLHGNRNS